MEIHSPSELDDLERKVLAAAERAVTEIRLAGGAGIEFLRRLTFEECGRHPMEDRALNLVEQVNQTFTYLASFRAAKELFRLHPEVRGLRLNLGTKAGSDIEDVERVVLAAEVFAAVRPQSNRKLFKDINKVASSLAANKYVFFLAPKFAAGRQPRLERNGVQVWCVDL
jgi:hypothetical protein